MPVTFRIDTDAGVVFTTYEGVVTMQEALAHLQALSSHRDFDPTLRQLSDARSATQAVASEDIRRLAKLDPFAPDVRRAILVSDDATFGLARMYQAQVSNGATLGVFRDPAEALGWIGLPPETDIEGTDSRSSVA